MARLKNNIQRLKPYYFIYPLTGIRIIDLSVVI